MLEFYQNVNYSHIEEKVNIVLELAVRRKCTNMIKNGRFFRFCENGPLFVRQMLWMNTLAAA